MTTMSRARREAVVERLSCYFEDYNQWPAQDREDVASEIIAVALPDRETLTLALARLAQAAYDDGMHGRAVPSYAANLGPVLALVYGDDDAQAGEE